MPASTRASLNRRATLRSWLRRPPGRTDRTLTTSATIRNRPTRNPLTSPSVAWLYAAGMWLVCTRRCGGDLFRAMSAEVDVDAAGEYLGHRIVQPSYQCLNCGAPAMDLGAVPEATPAQEADEAESAVASLAAVCRACE